ncbi:hypothetical protein U1Q18_042522 [Sarracenia purpurea var. burkii]
MGPNLGYHRNVGGAKSTIYSDSLRVRLDQVKGAKLSRAATKQELRSNDAQNHTLVLPALGMFSALWLATKAQYTWIGEITRLLGSPPFMPTSLTPGLT